MYVDTCLFHAIKMSKMTFLVNERISLLSCLRTAEHFLNQSPTGGNSGFWSVQAAGTQLTRLGGLCLSQLWRRRSLRSGAGGSSVQWELSSWFTDTCLPAVSSHGRKGKGALWVLFYEGTNPIHGDSALVTSSPPKAPPPNTNTLGEWVSTSELRGGNSNIQFKKT